MIQNPLRSHLIEIKFRFFYFFFSLFCSFIIILNYHEAIFFFSTYPISFLNQGKFITTHVAELFATYIYISFNFVALIHFPYAYYHCSKFLSSSWYKAQIWFFKNIQISCFFSFFTSLVVCYFAILPYACMFLDTWTITIVHAFQVQLETRIETYIWWTMQTTYLLSNLVYLFFIRVTYFYLMDNMINLHVLYRKNKKYTPFFVCLITSVCVPPETIIQLLSVLSTLLVLEAVFFITCIFFAKNSV